MTLAEFWPLCLLRLQRNLPVAQFDKWIAPVGVGEENGEWVVYGKNQFACNMLKSQFGGQIEAVRAELAPERGAFAYKVGSGVQYPVAVSDRLMPSENQGGSSRDKPAVPPAEEHVAAVVAEAGKPASRKSALDIVERHTKAAAERREEKGGNPEIQTAKVVVPKPKADEEDADRRFRQTNLKPEYTFETLAEGKGNQVAMSAAKAIADKPGGNYNPFFLYGSTGLGKTHLVQAIGNELLQRTPEAKVRYMHSDEYVRSLMAAFRNNNYDGFKQQYRQYDLLIIDDIQFIKGKDRTMEEFFFLYNHFYENQKQLILTCDVLPKEIEDMDDRLKSRFVWGLTLELEPPEFEMRVSILQKKADAAGVHLPSDVAEFIAHHVRSNVRELEGAFKQVEARASFERNGINIDLARAALQNIIASNHRVITADLILDIVAKHYSVKISELTGKKRTRNIARPRQVSMSLIKELTSLSYQEVGQALGGRDHSTVIHGVETVAKLRESSPEVAQDYEKLLNLIQN